MKTTIIDKVMKTTIIDKAKGVVRGAMPLCLPTLLLFLTACQSDWRNGIVAPDEASQQPQAITFTASVASSAVTTRADGSLVPPNESQLPITRADGSLVNLKEHQLPQTKLRSYWRAGTDGTVKEVKKAYRVGLFGCYTGQHTWSYLTALAASVGDAAIPSQQDQEKLSQFYTPNLLYNDSADIKADGTLEYAPLRFWPNNKLEDATGHDKLESATGHEYCTFWAYYPYNPTATPGTYGISITKDSNGSGKGMGSVTFTMHPDAAQQNDFMISLPVTDCNRDKYPLIATSAAGNPTPVTSSPSDPADPSSPVGESAIPSQTQTYSPKPVPLRFYHMLAQVRLYAFIRGNDKMVYKQDDDGHDQLADATWLASQSVGDIITDEYGNVYELKGKDEEGKWIIAQTTTGKPDLSEADFLALRLRVPDEENCIRWDRTGGTWDVTHSRRRANITYKMEFNNIRTTATFYPKYNADGTASLAYDEGPALGSATVNHYIMNPYWFRFNEAGQRYMLNDNYMYGYFEDTDGYNPDPADKDKYLAEDGIDWSSYAGGISNAMGYDIDNDGSGKEFYNEEKEKHYNYAPGNILMVVPQVLDDDNVPHIVLTATGKASQNGVEKEWTAKVTINMLQMNLKWESGFIYSYAFIDELRPGDDIVRGPESITVIFDPTKHTDQW